MDNEENTFKIKLLKFCHNLVIFPNNRLFHNTEYEKTCIKIYFLGLLHIIITIEDIIICLIHYIF